jgi:Na+(H+)/acetate symporter ActP
MIGMCIVFIYAALGGMKGITWTQVCQYCVLIVAYIIPAVAISMIITGIPIPQIGFGSSIAGGADAGKYLLDTLNVISKDLGLCGVHQTLCGCGQGHAKRVLHHLRPYGGNRRACPT